MELNFLLFPAPKLKWDPKELAEFVVYIPVVEEKDQRLKVPEELRIKKKNFDNNFKKTKIKNGKHDTSTGDSIADKLTLKEYSNNNCASTRVQTVSQYQN